MKTVSAPSRRSSDSIPRPSFSSLPTKTVFAPRPARRRTVASPIPAVPPVMSATLSSKFIGIAHLPNVFHYGPRGVYLGLAARIHTRLSPPICEESLGRSFHQGPDPVLTQNGHG